MMAASSLSPSHPCRTIAMAALISVALLVCTDAAPVSLADAHDQPTTDDSATGLSAAATGLIVLFAVGIVILCADGTDDQRRMAAVDDMALSRRATMASEADMGSGAASFITETSNPLIAQMQEKKQQQLVEEQRRSVIQAPLEMMQSVAVADDDDEGRPAGRRRSTLGGSFRLSNSPQWIHEGLNRKEAAQLLREQTAQNGTFIVRAKKPEEGLYALDIGNLNDAGEVMVSHHVISRAETGQYLLDDQVFDRFNSMESLVSYLMKPGNKALRKGYLTKGIKASVSADNHDGESAAC
eukprot:m.95397 g.95397  ORF g.95397 m.95397 type:complete len:297 (+) comp15153_c0_seq2:383-1273(+)